MGTCHKELAALQGVNKATTSVHDHVHKCEGDQYTVVPIESIEELMRSNFWMNYLWQYLMNVKLRFLTCPTVCWVYQKHLRLGEHNKFDNSGCDIRNKNEKVIGFTTRVGNLHYLEYCRKAQRMNVARSNGGIDGMVWTYRWAKTADNSGDLMQQLNYDTSKSIGFCETCIGGKHYHDPFGCSSTQLLEIAHSDVCGKISEKSLGAAQCFLTFTDDKSGYSWVYTERIASVWLISRMEGTCRGIQQLEDQKPSEPTTVVSIHQPSLRSISRQECVYTLPTC